jgi:hypothetical protein
MMAVTIELDRDVPAATVDILSGVPGVVIKRHARKSQLRVNGTTVPLALVPGRLKPLAKATAPWLARTAGPGRLGFVVADRLPEHVRRELEDAGCAYADGTGAAHIDVPGVLIHTEGKASRHQQNTPPPRGIGVVGVRVIQTLLGQPDVDWSVPALAGEAACSIGEAHRILRRLEDEGLVAAHGRARGLRRRVADPGELLDWLSSVPSARRIREQFHSFLYVSDPKRLATTISELALDAGLVYAFSGMAAAAIWGRPVATSIPETMVRVHPDVPLAKAAELLRAEPVDSGANMVLVRDFGEVGVHGRQRNGPAEVAPRIRVWLDILGEPRGEDAAAIFREGAIGW